MSEIPELKYVPYTGMFECGINHPCYDCYWYREEIDMGAHIPYCACKTKFSIEPDDCKDCSKYHSKYHLTNTIERVTGGENMIKILKKGICEGCSKAELFLDKTTTIDGQKLWSVYCKYSDICDEVESRVIERFVNHAEKEEA